MQTILHSIAFHNPIGSRPPTAINDSCRNCFFTCMYFKNANINFWNFPNRSAGYERLWNRERNLPVIGSTSPRITRRIIEETRQLLRWYTNPLKTILICDTVNFTPTSHIFFGGCKSHVHSLLLKHVISTELALICWI